MTEKMKTEEEMKAAGVFKFGLGQEVVGRFSAENMKIKARVYDVDKQDWCYVLSNGSVVPVTTFHNLANSQ